MKTETSFSKILLALLAFIGAMIFVRFYYTGKFHFVFLIWNLFLAWIPFFISGAFQNLNRKSWLEQGLVFFTWLLFFPNALYIVTDLIHLNSWSIVPKWFDAILIFTASVTGLIMAFVSLLRVEKYLSLKFNKNMVQVGIAGILFLSSFGVYLGRFLRWNSWDILSNPIGLLHSIAQRIIFPFRYFETWGITLILATVFYLLFIALKKMPSVH